MKLTEAVDRFLVHLSVERGAGMNVPNHAAPIDQEAHRGRAALALLAPRAVCARLRDDLWRIAVADAQETALSRFTSTGSV